MRFAVGHTKKYLVGQVPRRAAGIVWRELPVTSRPHSRVHAGITPWRWILPMALSLLPVQAVVAQATLSPVFRFFNQQTGTHFYTIVAAERDQVIAGSPQFVYEGPAFAAYAQPAAGAQPVFRFYNSATRAHFYTDKASDRDYVLATWPQFVFEGTAYYAMPSAGTDGRTELFRFFNTTTGTHFYTDKASERDYVLATWPQFKYEGVAFYVYDAAGVPVPPVVVASSDGFRFLQQTSFGPTPAALGRIGAIGVAAYLEEQFGQPASGYPDATYSYLSLDESDACSFSAPRQGAAYACALNQLTLFKMRNQFFANALTQPDQLRQRVAWSLSQFFVVSAMKDPDMEAAYVMARYHQMLFAEAFGNVENLLLKVTLSPQMGHYLDMVDNAKADPGAGTEPNENFARELMQLFSIGVNELNADGTPILDAANQPIPSYGQPEIKAFARVFTGWTYPPFDAPQAAGPDDRRYFAKPMVPVPADHDTSAKVLLKGTTLPAGQTADADVRAAIHNVFMHPNAGPFFAKHLIRQMVTGNPTPAYVGRVAAAFANNGSGVRGDMKAVLRAVLLDAEARGDAKADATYGMLKEPVLYVTSLLRQLGATSDGAGLERAAKAMGQDVFYSPTVFNYYPADYRIPGTSVVAPQFGIHNTNTVLHRVNFAYDMIYDGGYGPDGDVPNAVGTHLDLAPFARVAADPVKLVAMINDRLFGGGMPLGIKAEITTAVAALPADDPDERARTAVFLAATSFQFQVAK
ncbi:MAG TPA: DUF1800 family protein [Casimicrobiaceae bacterium]|nr:DUF1800 family protein [Casimicrobiaceae bacterium]